jgi:hypothetical protein
VPARFTNTSVNRWLISPGASSSGFSSPDRRASPSTTATSPVTNRIREITVWWCESRASPARKSPRARRISARPCATSPRGLTNTASSVRHATNASTSPRCHASSYDCSTSWISLSSRDLSKGPRAVIAAAALTPPVPRCSVETTGLEPTTPCLQSMVGLAC